jgi:hypothetical protein
MSFENQGLIAKRISFGRCCYELRRQDRRGSAVTPEADSPSEFLHFVDASQQV